jgi:glycosyltransferase involved in cell wall biosynthesis
MLLIGSGIGHLHEEANRRGFEVSALSIAEFEAGQGQMAGEADVCVLFGALERFHNPVGALRQIRDQLAADGALMVIAPTIDSRAARLFATGWWEFSRSNLFYFSVDTLQSLLIKAGFGDPIITQDRSFASLNYLRERLQQHPSKIRHRRYILMRKALSISPILQDKTFRMLYGRTRVLVKAKGVPVRPVLSVIVPVFNEARTFTDMMDQLVSKTIDGISIQIIVVESNSSDGSRELVLRYAHHPRVVVILQDRAMGKGHAVRAGLKTATGDLVLFQDADLEYDLNDYEGLIVPLLRFESNFVLGSRHSTSRRGWKIREFTESPTLSAVFNLGHIFFLTLFNLLYSQHLTDPFTMFKVFRRECLYGLEFECNRFDFDYEIVIKLLRKGYKALELPVNYKSRSLEEGKKVTMFRDPITWIKALFKFRNSLLYSSPPANRAASIRKTREKTIERSPR